MKYINTALALAMLQDGNVKISTLSEKQAKIWLEENFENATNACNPHHANTLNGLTRQLGVNVQSGATGERFTMDKGDECLVFGLVPPKNYGRETREFTDDELAECRITFRLVQME